MLKNFLFSWVILFFGFALNSQEALVYTQDFTVLLDNAPIEFSKPQGWFKVFPYRDDYGFGDYDLVLNSEDKDMQIRLKYYSNNPDKVQYPDFEFSRMMTHIATNDDQSLLFFKGIESLELARKYRADWGALATFTPKENFSDKQRGKLLSLFHEQFGFIQIIYLYNGSSEQVYPFMEIMRFKS